MINIAYKIIFVILLTSPQLSARDMRALLFDGNCATCHFPTKADSAPSIQEIQTRYKDVFQNKKDFVEYMSEWVAKPNMQRSLMSQAIKKYELMPEMGYSLDTLKEISSYIYDTKF